MRVLIVEDSGFMADALIQLISTIPDVTVVGQAVNQADAVALGIALQPDLVILDLQIKNSPYGESSPDHGLATLYELRSLERPPEVMVFSHMPEQPWLRTVAQAGAAGFISKDSSTTVIAAALQAIGAGMRAFTPAQMQILQQPKIALSRREREVLSLLADGLSNQDIATRLGISIGTARKHVENLCTAFGVNSRLQVVAAARRAGLLSP